MRDADFGSLSSEFCTVFDLAGNALADRGASSAAVTARPPA